MRAANEGCRGIAILLRPQVLEGGDGWEIWAEGVLVLCLGAATRLAELIPSCRCVILEGVGHLPMMEAPDQLNRLLEEYLEQLA